MTTPALALRGRARLAALACALAHPLSAQSRAPAPRAVGAVVNVVLADVLPPGERLGSLPVERRGIYVDVGRTAAAFGLGPDGVAPAALGLDARLTPGDRSLLADCGPPGRGACGRLGRGAYVYVEPLTANDSVTVVRATVLWPYRRRETPDGPVSPTDEAALTGFAAQLRLGRAPGGGWRIVQRLPTLAF